MIHVHWSPEDAQYVATHHKYPSLSWLADTPEEAALALDNLIEDAEQEDRET